MRNLILVLGDPLDLHSSAFAGGDPERDRQYDAFKDNRRMTFPIKNIERLRSKKKEHAAIKQRAVELRTNWRQ